MVYFWQHEYPLLSGRPEGSVVTRLNAFLRPKPIRYMVSQLENKLDLSRIMDEGKILLARIPHGLIGEENAHLLGSLLVAKIHQLVLGRQSLAVNERRPFWLYIDEFHQFMTKSMASILSGARKYNLGLILAHQELQQLDGRDRDVASAVTSNVYTRVCFRLGNQDARKLEDGFSAFDSNDLQSLDTGQAICRVGGAENDFNLAVPWETLEPSAEQGAIIESIQANTRKNFARPKSEVEAEIAKQRPAPPAKKEAAEPPAESLAPPSAREARSPSQAELPTRAAEQQTPATPNEVSPAAQQASSSPGRGGPEHKALQAFVKHLAEGFNYRVTIEKPILAGKGHVDLALERDACRIGVEISITTPVDKEVQNLRKCLDAGFDPVIMLAPDHDRLGKIRAAAEATFEQSELGQLRFCLSEEVAEVLQQFASAESDSEGVIHKGYAVKATFKEMGEAETQSKRRKIRKTIGAALRKLGNK